MSDVLARATERRPSLSAGRRRLRAHYDVLAFRHGRALVRYAGHADAYGNVVPTAHQASPAPVWVSVTRLRIHPPPRESGNVGRYYGAERVISHA